MTKYLLIAFLSPDDRIVTRVRTRDDYHAYCQLCVREINTRFNYVEYSDLETVVARDWSNIQSLNIGGIMIDKEIYYELIILEEMNSDEIWLLSHEILLRSEDAEFLKNKQIDSRIISYREYINVHSHNLAMLRFRSKVNLFEFLRYRSFSLTQRNVVILGWKELPTESFWAVEFREGADLFLWTHFPNSRNLDCFLKADHHFEQYWRFSIKIDSSIFDTFDPIYCTRREDIDILISKLSEKICRKYDCELHLLPMNRSIMSNWFGFFEIPVKTTR